MDTLALAGDRNSEPDVIEVAHSEPDVGSHLPDTETAPISAPDETIPSSNGGAATAMMPRSRRDYNYFEDMREALANLHAEDGTVTPADDPH